MISFFLHVHPARPPARAQVALLPRIALLPTNELVVDAFRRLLGVRANATAAAGDAQVLT